MEQKVIIITDTNGEKHNFWFNPNNYGDSIHSLIGEGWILFHIEKSGEYTQTLVFQRDKL